MNGSARVIGWLEDKSDWLSPLVVKEVRQVVRGREFILSFSLSLAAGLLVAFFGASEAVRGSSTSGRGTFAALMGCLAFLGLAVVPLGAFSALRNERAEQTLELITLTALSSRRIVIGKILAQAVKLATFFAAMAPFITMSFLLGGIDFVTILISLVTLFMGSLWAGALCLFLSTTSKSRAMSGLVFGAVGILVFMGFVMSRSLFIAASMGGVVPGPLAVTATGAFWWVLAITTTLWLASLVNLILLAENRLSLSTEDSVTPLRIGFLVQFLLIVALTLAYLADPPIIRARAAETLAVAGTLHLAIVAMFVVTEGLTVPRRVLSRMRSPSRWRWLLATFGPGGGRGAAYVIVQMLILLVALAVLQPPAVDLRWGLAACGYICFFTAVPTVAFLMLAPSRVTSLRLRAAVLVSVALWLVLPDIIHYVVMRPESLDLDFGVRHLINPFATLANWRVVEAQGWVVIPFAIGLIGVVACLTLVRLGTRDTGEAVRGDARN